MSIRIYCDGGRGDRLCSAQFYQGQLGTRATDHGWVRTKDGLDLCPAHAPRPKTTG